VGLCGECNLTTQGTANDKGNIQEREEIDKIGVEGDVVEGN